MDQAKQSTEEAAPATKASRGAGASATMGQAGSTGSKPQAPTAEGQSRTQKSKDDSRGKSQSSVVNQQRKIHTTSKTAGTHTQAGNASVKEPPGETRKKDPPAASTATSVTGATDGNDQVTKETPHKPLAAQVPTSTAASAASQSKQQSRQRQQQTQQPASKASAVSSSSAAAAVAATQQALPSKPMDPGMMKRPPGTSQPPSTSAAAAMPQQSQAQIQSTTQTHPAAPPQQQVPGTLTTASHYSQQHPAAIDHRSLYEEQIAQQRSVLVDRYAPYIEHSDRSLNDARRRLETALKQVRHLREAFTERVYGKYRVCLKPPETFEETLHGIKTNPASASRRLEQHIRQVKEEKDLEKKEAQTLNAELSKMDPSLLASVSADNAEQLMYISAGLSLVILPEDDVDPKMLQGYDDRAPVHPATGRVRSISQAAAAAGDVILERTRKAKAMRKQFLQQRKSSSDQHSALQSSNQRTPLELLTTPVSAPPIAAAPVAAAKSQGSSSVASGAGGLEVKTVNPNIAQMAAAQQQPTIVPKIKIDTKLANVQNKSLEVRPVQLTPVATQASSSDARGSSKKPISFSSAPPPSTSKFGRSRGGAGISVQLSLSLNPTADEITDRPSRASTAALLARGVGTAQGISRASPQQRLRHPHPESAGGRQRASSATSARKELATLKQAPSPTTSQSYLNFALPPLPTPLERRERKPLTVLDPSRSGSVRAKRAIASVLGNLNRRTGSGGSSSTKIGLLHDIHRSRRVPAKNGSESPRDRPIDPTLAFSVLQSIGLITEASHQGDGRTPAMLEDRVQNLPNGEKRKLESLEGLTTMWDKLGMSKRPRFSDPYLKGPASRSPQKAPAVVKPVSGAPVATAQSSPPVENIRGGGLTPQETSAGATGRRSPPVEHIRGGGEMMSDANGDPTGNGGGPGDANSRKNNQRSGGGRYGNHVPNRVDNRMMANNMPQNARHAQPRWDGQSLNMMNAHMAANSVAMGMNHPQGGVNGQVPQNHPGQQANANNAQAQSNYALHLAHQLRNATNNMAGMQGHNGHQHQQGEVPVANYMGNLHQGGQWSAIGNSAAVMAAAQSSLAALGLAVPMNVYSSVQDRAARALLAREQQNVAAAHAVAAHQQSIANSAFAGGAANPGFPPSNSSPTIQQRSNARNAMHNPAARQSYGVANQSSVVSPGPQMSQQQRFQVMQQATSPARNTAQAPRQSDMQYQQRATVPVQKMKRKADEALKEKPRSDQQKPNAQAPSKRPKQSVGGRVAAVGNGNGTANIAPKISLKGGTETSKPASETPARKVAASASVSSQKGMQFFPPGQPALLSSQLVTLVRTSQLHRLAGAMLPNKQPQNASEILDFLVAVGSAVPIPKALISSSLKDRLNIPGFKNLASRAGFVIPREIVVAAILVWLWSNHEQGFQRAFSKSGRIDVDPTCKWLVQAAVDASVRALTLYITESGMTAGVPRKIQENSTEIAAPDTSKDATFSVGLASACVVSKALTTESCKDIATDHTLPRFHELTRFLDECRLVALHSRSQERVLLASLISLKSVMSESFAHAYVSSIVRAGDALGHEALAEIVADDDLKISSMMPYDILREDTGFGGWEDPGRPLEGYSPNLTGDVLTKVAHARSIIQKSLRRLQDRHSIKQGTPTFGAYADLASGQSQTPGGSSASTSANKNGFGGTPKALGKRRMSSAATSGGPVPDGTGSAPATSWALYDPKHFSAPLPWDINATANTPYGRHRGNKPSSLGPSPNSGFKKPKNPTGPPPAGERPGGYLGRGTFEIDWRDVAESFHNVKLPRGASAPAPAPLAPAASFKTIISPFCREVEKTPEPSDEESDTEEDLSDEAVLARHQMVLDGMKEKLTAFMEARKKMVERRKKTQENSKK